MGRTSSIVLCIAVLMLPLRGHACLCARSRTENCAAADRVFVARVTTIGTSGADETIGLELVTTIRGTAPPMPRTIRRSAGRSSCGFARPAVGALLGIVERSAGPVARLDGCAPVDVTTDPAWDACSPAAIAAAHEAVF